MSVLIASDSPLHAAATVIAEAGHLLVTVDGDTVAIAVDVEDTAEALFAVTPTLEDVWRTPALEERRAAILAALPSEVADAFAEWEPEFEAPELTPEQRIAQLEQQLAALLEALGG